MKFNGLKIIVENTGRTFHTLDDWGLYIQNTDYIGEPQRVENLIHIPGREGYIDLSKTLAGHSIYSSRKISPLLAGFRNKKSWDSLISKIRNEINGRICKFIFDNDKDYYWRGKVNIYDFNSVLKVGSLRIEIPEAEPYKKSIISSMEPWLWNPFNFDNGVITYIGTITVSGSTTIVIPKGHMPVMPKFTVSNKASGIFSVTCDGISHELSVGLNKIPSIIVGGDNDVSLTFTGTAKVEVNYRSGSL